MTKQMTKINTPNSKRGTSLLVDYSRCAAKTAEPGNRGNNLLSLNTAAQACMLRSIQQHAKPGQMQTRAEDKVPDFVFVKRAGPAPSSPPARISFQLRRSMVDRESFLSYLKLHYSESDSDLEIPTEEEQNVEDDQSILSKKDTQLLQQSRHTVSYEHPREKKSRRNNLKETLKRSTSHTHLDTSPLARSVHDQPISLSLHKSKSYNGKSSLSLLHASVGESERPNGNSAWDTTAKTSKRRSFRCRLPPRNRSSNSTGSSLAQRLAALEDVSSSHPNSNEKDSYLPSTLQVGNRRTMTLADSNEDGSSEQQSPPIKPSTLSKKHRSSCRHSGGGLCKSMSMAELGHTNNNNDKKENETNQSAADRQWQFRRSGSGLNNVESSYPGRQQQLRRSSSNWRIMEDDPQEALSNSFSSLRRIGSSSSVRRQNSFKNLSIGTDASLFITGSRIRRHGSEHQLKRSTSCRKILEEEPASSKANFTWGTTQKRGTLGTVAATNRGSLRRDALSFLESFSNLVAREGGATPSA